MRLDPARMLNRIEIVVVFVVVVVHLLCKGSLNGKNKTF